MANSFAKETVVAFDNALASFDDNLILSNAITKEENDAVKMARANDVVWFPKPYAVTSYSGTDMSSNFAALTQLVVPIAMNTARSVPLALSLSDARDPMQETKLVESAIKKLASDINMAVVSAASLKGSLVLTSTTVAGSFADVANIETRMNENGVSADNRSVALSSAAYNGLAKDLAIATRNLQGSGKSLNAYEKAFIGQVASFDTYKLDYAYRLPAAVGSGLTIDTRDAAVNYDVPVATVSVNGQLQNHDSRYCSLTVSATTGIVVGDAFTIAGVNEVHAVTKQDTGTLKTFRVITVTDGTHLVVSPALVSNQVASASATQYQNCVVNTKSATSAIVFKNTVAAQVSPFWAKDAIKLMAGRYNMGAIQGNASVLSARTESGIEILVTKTFDSFTGNTLIRADTLFGVDVANPEMAGIALFSQSA